MFRQRIYLANHTLMPQSVVSIADEATCLINDRRVQRLGESPAGRRADAGEQHLLPCGNGVRRRRRRRDSCPRKPSI